jgi:hypothetical protein
VTILVLVAGGALGSVAAPGTAGATGTDVKAFMTLYGWADNSPPGPGIAHTTCLHGTAGGTGTYADPVTFATDVAELPWCTRIYVPYMRRYFIHEDECSECDTDWTRYGLYRFDMWAGGDAASVHQPERRDLLRCESTWTMADSVSDPDNPEVVVNPPPGEPVTTLPIFSPASGCWPGPIALDNPGKQTTARGSAVNLQIDATDAIAGQTLAFAASGLPTGAAIDPRTGRISGDLPSAMRRKVTVTASDSADSAAVTFVWVVTRR